LRSVYERQADHAVDSWRRKTLVTIASMIAWCRFRSSVRYKAGIVKAIDISILEVC
jgi:hypothetical protein